MSIPDVESIMLPLLKYASDGKEHSLSEARESLAKEFALTDEERNQLLKGGRQRVFDNRVSWAKIFLDKAGLLTTPKSGSFQISDVGLQALAQKPDKITSAYLAKRPQHTQAFKRPVPQIQNIQGTPDEMMGEAYQAIRQELAETVLEHVIKCSPQFFERLVVDLLTRMGYGGYREEAGQVTGRSGDEGIDGIIYQDRLGLDVIYLQAKRWEGTVGRPEIQKFVGALTGKRARKGVFITTGSFTDDARNYVTGIDTKVVLIDGGELAEYMIDHDLGVRSDAIYEVKKIDQDFFIEE